MKQIAEKKAQNERTGKKKKATGSGDSSSDKKKNAKYSICSEVGHYGQNHKKASGLGGGKKPANATVPETE
ncbi:hypothetical protein TWF730_005877 [Orbilia blumenaviensis]|uniref:Uncharacterized protein n=1 Tax=Orbilia blumenaviensis TaxID=1796055 RepID=A0AAV9VLW0_9PEZI